MMRRDAHFNRPEDRQAVRVAHLDADPVAELQERRLRLAGLDRFDHANLRNAGVTHAAVLDRPARAAVELVGDP